MLSQYAFNMPFHVLGYFKPLLWLLSKSYKLKFLKGCVLGTFPYVFAKVFLVCANQSQKHQLISSCLSWCNFARLALSVLEKGSMRFTYQGDVSKVRCCRPLLYVKHQNLMRATARKLPQALVILQACVIKHLHFCKFKYYERLVQMPLT